VKSSILKNIATLGPVGYLPFAPGTWGTLTATVLIFFLKPGAPLHAALTLVFIVLGVFSANEAEKIINKKDPSCIIIDEFAGYLSATIFLPLNFGYILAAFILFRVFDILKPWPIKTVEKLGGGPGIMADDIVAGIMANLVLQVWRALA
jgi:phosphatidylglycerophosphatase A